MTDATQPSEAVATFLAPIRAAKLGIPDAVLAWAIDFADWPFYADLEDDGDEWLADRKREGTRSYLNCAELLVPGKESTLLNVDAIEAVAAWFGLDCFCEQSSLGTRISVRRLRGSYSYDGAGELVCWAASTTTSYDRWVAQQRKALGVAS